MGQELAVHRVEVSFVGRPPAEKIARAAGVSDVQNRGRSVSCTVSGSFQPFLEALHGHEVIALSSTPIEGARS